MCYNSNVLYTFLINNLILQTIFMLLLMMIRTLSLTFTQAEDIGTKLHVKIPVYDWVNHVINDVESLQDEEDNHLSSCDVVPEFRRKFAYYKKNTCRRIGD